MPMLVIRATESLPKVEKSEQEEACERLLLHASHAANEGFNAPK